MGHGLSARSVPPPPDDRIPGEALSDTGAWVAAAFLAALTALLAWISIPVPFSPVPFTGQLIPVLAAGMVLGPRHGVRSMLLYVGMGLSGLPVFSRAQAGPAVLLGPTGGYLVGFVLCALVTGHLGRRWRTSSLSGLAALMVPGLLIVLASGAAWLVAGHRVPPSGALATGVLPFLVPGAIKVVLAAILVRALRARFGRLLP